MLDMKIMITGSNGFVGAAISQALATSNYKLVTPVRPNISSAKNQNLGEKDQIIDGICASTNWESFLDGVDTIVHCAAVTDVGVGINSRHSQALRSVNVDGTLNLARQAVSKGIRRFVFISSIKVNGDSTRPNYPFSPDDNPFPTDAYGVSKYDAEKGLWKISHEANLELVIIRPPLVYGPNVKGNFSKMIKLIELGFPLPLLKIKNQRSFIGIDNLTDLVIRCITHPKASNQTFLASDDYDLSTPKLLRCMAHAMGKRSRLFPCSPQVLSKTASFFNQEALADRLLGSLQIDISKTKTLLGWSPPIDVTTGLSRCFQKTITIK